MKGWALFMKQQDDQAIEWLRRAEGGVVFTELILASALALTGRQAEARETLKRYSTMTGVTTTTIERHARRRAQFPGLCLLGTRDRKRTLEIRFRFRRVRLRG
jgi:hypothetical protein